MDMNDAIAELEALDDFDNAPVRSKSDGHIRTGTVESTVSESKIARFEEKCAPCRGTGKFYSYTGRYVGPCFKCKGEGVCHFKTSPETRAKARERVINAKNRKATEKATKVLEWLDANPERAAFLRQTWEFPRSLSESLGKFGSLTEGQVAAIDKCLATQAAREVADTAAGGIDISGLRTGLYLVKGVEFKIDNIQGEGRWNGWVFVKELDNKIGSQRPGHTYKGKRKEHLVEILKDPKAAAVAYGRETGTCGCCGRTLTNPESIEAGIGPICASRF